MDFYLLCWLLICRQYMRFGVVKYKQKKATQYGWLLNAADDEDSDL